MHYIPLPTPFHYATSLKRLTNMPRQVVARVEPGPVYVRALAQGERLGLVRIWEQEQNLAVSITGELDPAQVLHSVRRAFSLDLDLSGFYRHMDRHDPVMAQLARKYYGARPIQSFDLWESLAWSIMSQQVNVAFAFTLQEGLVRLGGLVAEGYPAFPAPETVAALAYEQLQAVKYTRRKAEYLIDLARAIAAGDLDLSAIVQLPYAEAVARLVQLRGVGRWTAECVLLESGAAEGFPAGDIGIRNAVQRFYALAHRPDEQEVRDLGRAWSPYKALACYYLWLGLLDEE